MTGVSLHGERSGRGLTADLFISLRPEQWTKNLVVWAPFASNVYHDWLWYPTVGQSRIRKFSRTEWGRLWATYREATAGTR